MLRDVKLKFFLELVKQTSNTRTNNLLNKDVTEIKLEPDDFQESIVNISEQTEVTSDSSELSQIIDKSCKSK